MGTIVEAIVPADEFALQKTADELTGISFQLERVVAQDAEHIMPFLRELKANHDLSDAYFLVGGFGYLTALARTDLRGDLDYVHRNKTVSD